jgi:hypothetical protein
MAGMARICAALKRPMWGVGKSRHGPNAAGLEQMGIRMLLNECEIIKRDKQCIFLAGIDDAHNIEKAASGIPNYAFSAFTYP